jgi:hypothetical protein
MRVEKEELVQPVSLTSSLSIRHSSSNDRMLLPSPPLRSWEKMGKRSEEWRAECLAAVDDGPSLLLALTWKVSGQNKEHIQEKKNCASFLPPAIALAQPSSES